MITLLLVLSLFGAEQANWDCRNQVEIRCIEGKCESTDQGEFTPMSISFSDKGEVSVCAYTGCWNGNGRVTKSDTFLSVTAENLSFSTNDSSKASVAIVLDRNDKTGLVKVGEFAQPIVCKKTNERISY